MDAGSLFGRAVSSFERLLRIIYPGLLFWVLLPTALPSDKAVRAADLSLWTGFYKELTAIEHVGFILTAGLVFYIIQRYWIHEPFLAFILFPLGIGSAVNFRTLIQGAGRLNAWYPLANGRTLWTRFGRRPGDSASTAAEGESAENRFDGYMATRMAWVHSLGSTWLILAVVGVIAVFNESALRSLGLWWTLAYGGLTSLTAMLWMWHAVIAARAEQAHYLQPGQVPL